MKRNTVIIIAVVLVILIVAAVFGISQMTASASATNIRAQTTNVQRGTLVASVSAAGNVSAPDDAVMAFQQSGRVSKVNVQIGDVVKKDQVLMELDTTDLDLSLKTAKSNLANSQANLDQTKANLQFALRNAQATLASSKANLDAAKAKNDQNPNQLITAKTALDKATITLQKAQGDYNAIAWRGDIGMTTQAQTLQTATADYENALANYKITAAGINDSALKSAQAQLDKDSVALEQAQKNLDTQLRTAQSQVDSSQIALEQAQRNIEKARIVAPFDGVVSVVNFSVGDTAGSGTAVTIVDIKALQVKVTVAEVDIDKIKVGQTADITLDALAGKTYAAKVIAIAPVATVTQGVVNYPVTLSVNNSDGNIKPGMTANLAIAVDRRDNVLLVPLRAVQTRGNTKTVTVQYKGQNIPTTVVTGLSNDTSIEITNGLQENDVVMINATQTRQSGGGMPGGAMFVGGPGGR